MRSENQVSETSFGAVPPGGVPGVKALVPTGDAPGGDAGKAAQRNKSNTLFNYEINKEFYKKSKISSTIINYSFFLEKHFQKIKLLYEKKISLFLKKNPKYILFKFNASKNI